MSANYRDNLARVTLLERCRSLRKGATDAENLLWQLLRARQVGGVKFWRQHQYGAYILDFYAHEQKLVIEVDGGQHTEPIAADRDDSRTRYLESRGLRVLRFTNLEVLMETEAVLNAIWDRVEDALTPTLSQRERGQFGRNGGQN